MNGTQLRLDERATQEVHDMISFFQLSSGGQLPHVVVFVTQLELDLLHQNKRDR